ncbi:MAG: hypothetical protein ACLGRW_01155 [Acidobacteriota bacterium]|jgi:oligoendopeptidase F
MPSLVGLAASFLLSIVATQLYAAPRASQTLDQVEIQAIEARISQAEPRYQSFLYAKLVNDVTEASLQQYTAGNVSKAAGLLRKIQQLARRIQNTVTRKDKQLKKAELLLRNTSFRLSALLRSSSYQDRALVEQTLAEVRQAEQKAMLQVFSN